MTPDDITPAPEEIDAAFDHPRWWEGAETIEQLTLINEGDETTETERLQNEAHDRIMAEARAEATLAGFGDDDAEVEAGEDDDAAPGG